MADYSAPALRGSGSLNDYSFVSGQTYTFTLLDHQIVLVKLDYQVQVHLHMKP